MNKKSITHKDMIDAQLVKITKEFLSFSTVHGTIWEHPENDSLCGVVLYIPLQRKYAEKVLQMIRKEK